MLWCGLVACSTLTVEQEKQLGYKVQRQVRDEYQFVRDPVVVKYVQDLSQKLARAARPSPFEFPVYVVEDEEINVFSIPGGAIYVHTGLILAAEDVSEVAAPIAFAIAAVTERWVALQYRNSIAGLVTEMLKAILLGRTYVPPAGTHSDPPPMESQLKADQLAIETLISAGYDPNGLVRSLELLESKNPSSKERMQERIQSAKRSIAGHSPLPQLRTSDDGELEQIQVRLRTERDLRD